MGGKPKEENLEYVIVSGGNHRDRRKKPTIEQFEVSPKTILQGQEVKITYKVRDSGGSGLVRIELWRKDDGSASKQIKKGNAGGAKESGSFKDKPSTASNYSYSIRAVDQANNQVESAGRKEVKVSPLITAASNTGVGFIYADAEKLAGLSPVGSQQCVALIQK